MAKRGRPALADQKKAERISTAITVAQYQRTYARAQRDDVPISALMRQALTRLLDADDDTD